MVGIGVGRVKNGKRPAFGDTPVMLSTQWGCWLLLSKYEGQKSRKIESRITGFTAVSEKIPHV